MRSPDTLRSFAIRAVGGAELAFAAVHGLEGAAKVERVRPDSAVVKLDRLRMTPTTLGLSCSVACGIFPDQGLNLCLLHWPADSLPLSHQEALGPTFYISKLR